MADRDAVLRDPARTFYDSRSEAEQGELTRIFEDLCFNPYPDDVLKFELSPSTGRVYFYRDDKYYILYDEENNWTLAVWEIDYMRDDLTLGVERPES